MTIRYGTPTPDPRTAYGQPIPYRHASHLDDTPPAGRRVRTFVGGLLFAAFAFLALGAAGSSDYRDACADILQAGGSDSTDALQCAEEFPDLAGK